LRVNSPSFSGRIVPLFDTMLVHQGKGSCTPTEPYHTPFPEADTSSHPTTSSIPLPSIPTGPIPPVTQPDPTPIRQYSRRARIAQSSALPTVADEPASPVRDVSEGEACPTDSGFIADQDRATIAKSSTLPHDSAPRVTSPAADEGSMQHNISKLTALYTSLQRQYSELLEKFQDQEEEIVRLKERVQVLEDRECDAAKQSGDDAPIKGRSINEGEAVAERISNDSEEVARVLTSMDAAIVLAGGIDVPTGSGFIPTAGPPATVISTASERMPMTKKQKREYYMTVIKSNLGWRFKDFIGMTFEEIEAKFAEVWKQVKNFIPMGSKEETERLKRKDLLKQLDMEDLNQLWALVKEYLSIRPASSEKEMELWVELKRMYEPDLEDQLWTLTQNFMHAPVEWKLYGLSGVHHLTSKDKEIFMLVEKDYPLIRGLALVMISYKLQVKNYSQMAEDLIRKIYNITNTPRQQVKVVATARRFKMPLPEVCTAIEEKKKKLSVKDRWQLH
nr:hypothetical protein [Tanacetum cinerariifolium]